jgi:hypothetical protein
MPTSTIFDGLQNNFRPQGRTDSIRDQVTDFELAEGAFLQEVRSQVLRGFEGEEHVGALLYDHPGFDRTRPLHQQRSSSLFRPGQDFWAGTISKMRIPLWLKIGVDRLVGGVDAILLDA